jgi:hypothetical protein
MGGRRNRRKLCRGNLHAMTRLVSLKHVSFCASHLKIGRLFSIADLHSIFNLFLVERLDGAYLIHVD